MSGGRGRGATVPEYQSPVSIGTGHAQIGENEAAREGGPAGEAHGRANRALTKEVDAVHMDSGEQSS
jgi:hypothetical protein